MSWRGCMIYLKLPRSSDRITTLTYVLMDNFCPCLVIIFEFDILWYKYNNKLVFKQKGCSCALTIGFADLIKYW